MSSPIHTSAIIPPTLDHVVGQTQVTAKLKVAVEAAFADQQPLPHVMLTGPAGTGKTMLSQVVAREMATEFREVLGQSLVNVAALNGFLLGASEPRSILFIDEAHEIPASVQTGLLKAIDERAVFLCSDSDNKVSRLAIEPFTLVLATTDPQGLIPPLRDRMRLICQLRRYEAPDLVSILRQKVTQIQWEVEDAVLSAISERSFGTPRLALRLLEAVRRSARAVGATIIDASHAVAAFELEELDEAGLGPDERMYLSILAEASRPLRLGVIASRMGQPPEAVSRVVESNLIWLGLIERADRGRSLTAAGLSHVNSA